MAYKDGKAQGALTLIVPTSEARFLGNWDVIGLRATGSVDYVLEDVYVPKHMTHSPNTLKPRWAPVTKTWACSIPSLTW